MGAYEGIWGLSYEMMEKGLALGMRSRLDGRAGMSGEHVESHRIVLNGIFRAQRWAW